MTATIGGATISQTITVAAMATSATSSQVLNFSQLGISLTVNGYGANATGANIRNDFVTAANVTTDAGTASAAFQVGANANQTVTVGMSSSLSTNIGNGGGFGSLSAGVTAFAGASTTTNAQAMIQSVDKALADISSNRATLGAVQNRLEHTITNLQTSSENLQASESRIRDADMADEMVSFTRSNVLQQAGTSILAQANQLPQSILSLLR
ncbi:MAG: flagellin, partial [Chloroflexi bacterium]|nr:flagellin [Chloroflexota bacterium]